jgi:hypothetical protein
VDLSDFCEDGRTRASIESMEDGTLKGVPGSRGTTLSPPPELVTYFQLPSYRLNGTMSPIGVDMLALMADVSQNRHSTVLHPFGVYCTSRRVRQSVSGHVSGTGNSLYTSARYVRRWW